MNFKYSKPWGKLGILFAVLSVIQDCGAQNCDLIIDGPAKGKRCVFPFEFLAIKHFSCTTVSDPDNKPWCSTKTFPNGSHIGGQGNWGYCQENCLSSSSSSVNPVMFDEPRRVVGTRRTTRPPFRRTTKRPFTVIKTTTARPFIRSTVAPTTTTTEISFQRTNFVRETDPTSGLWIPDPDDGECGYGFNTDYITGGKLAKVGEFPFMALLGMLQRNGQLIYGCGGTLINRRYVVTAAHCKAPNFQIREVVLGETDTSKEQDCFDCPPVQRFSIRDSDIIVHEDYSLNTLLGQGNDIALIRLPSLAKTVYEDFQIKVGPACLPWKQEAVGDLRVVGWGRYSNDLSIVRRNLERFSVNSNNLLYAELENIPHPVCRSFKDFERVHPTRHICAAGRNGKLP